MQDADLSVICCMVDDKKVYCDIYPQDGRLTLAHVTFSICSVLGVEMKILCLLMPKSLCLPIKWVYIGRRVTMGRVHKRFTFVQL